MSYNTIVSNNLHHLIHDIKQAEIGNHEKQFLPTSKKELLAKIDGISCNLAPSYARDLWNPIKNFLKICDDRYFSDLNLSIEQIKKKYPKMSEAILNEIENIQMIAQLILQHGTNYKWNQGTCALQQLVCDMWNTFVVSSGFCTTKHCLAPIAKWGNDAKGPWALSEHHTKNISINGDSVPIISFPEEYSRKGILAWPVLGHEIAHTILESGLELSGPLSRAVRSDLKSKMPVYTANYWANRVSETGADVVNVLFMGPIAVLGLIGFLRSVHRDEKLSNKWNLKDTHPVDIMRALVMAQVVKKLNIQNSNAWFNFLINEIRKDYSLQDLKLTFDDACQQADLVAEAIMRSPIIQGKSLASIRSWNDHDEADVTSYINQITKGTKPQNDDHFKSPHIVAAANLHLLLKVNLKGNDQRVAQIFQHMIKQLVAESLRQKEICATCPLSQKDLVVLTPKKAILKKKSDDDLGLKVAGTIAVVGIVGLLGLMGLYFGLNSSSKNGQKMKSSV